MPDRAELRVDRDQCMGTGTCMVYAPTTLTFDDGKAAVQPNPTDDDDAVAAAIEACPTSALRLVEPHS